MRLIRICAIVSVLALHPVCNSLAGPDRTPVVPGDSEEQDDGQTEGNEEPGCD